jgi:hypothetical protein
LAVGGEDLVSRFSPDERLEVLVPSLQPTNLSKTRDTSSGNGRFRCVAVSLTLKRARWRGQKHLHYTPAPKVKIKIKIKSAGGTRKPPLGVPTITQRLAADPAAYPPPDGGWTDAGVRVILANPKYTGHQVFGRHRTRDGRRYHPR